MEGRVVFVSQLARAGSNKEKDVTWITLPSALLHIYLFIQVPIWIDDLAIENKGERLLMYKRLDTKETETLPVKYKFQMPCIFFQCKCMSYTSLKFLLNDSTQSWNTSFRPNLIILNVTDIAIENMRDIFIRSRGEGDW